MPNQGSEAIEAPPLGPAQRVVDTFVAPSKAFDSVRQNSDWWIPFIVASVVGVLYAFVLLHKIGLPMLVDSIIHQSRMLDTQLASATPEAAAQIRARVGTQLKLSYIAPVFSLLIGLACAGVLMATANFGAGGRSSYKQMMGVWFYGTLPLSLFYLLVMVAIYAGIAGDSYNMKNPIGTNIGFYLANADLPKTLMPLLSAFDLFAIWTAVLLTIGVSTVAGIKRGAAAVVVFGWWVVVILFQTVGAVFS